ncbi:uncharacterized protein LOC132733261 [Ruditapes philippinarum]|uniref:uncharacterized protein LOC132733261 n=1 Tax=Ruditapes philippinarum TaxID=129788 RepID=UPI00295A6155|nr:uncharacterized protein LOC132733261 [Ruditapes philippinarum]
MLINAYKHYTILLIVSMLNCFNNRSKMFLSPSNAFGNFKWFLFIIVLCLVKVTTLDFTISNDKVLEGSSGTLTMICHITETDVDYVFNIQILRIKSKSVSETNPSNWDSLAEMHFGQTERPSLSPAINASAKDYVAGGSWGKITPVSTYLTLSMNIEKLVCDDARAYKCRLIYKSSSSASIVSVENMGSFKVYDKPQITSLIARMNGILVQKSSSMKMVTCNVGDVIELTCTANIGSLPETIIRWRRAPANTSTDQFIDYQPAPGTNDDGTAISNSQCGYTRVASIRYKIEPSDVDTDRENDIGFECYISLSGDIYGNSFVTKDNPRFLADANELTTLRNPVDVTKGYNDIELSMSGMVGAIVVSLVVGILTGMLCTWIVLYRKRKSQGQSQQEQLHSIQAQETVFNNILSTSNMYEQLQNRTEMENKANYDTLKGDSGNKISSQTHYERLQQGANELLSYETLNIPNKSA